MSTPGLTENILLTLKWLWFANKHHLHALHFPNRTLNAVEDWLTDARREGLIDQIAWHNGETRQPSMWHLTDRGEDVIKRLAGNPGGPRRTRPRKVLEHDTRLLDMVVWVILEAREAGLCGLRVYREIQLLKGKRKPCMDGLVVFEVGGTYSDRHPNLLPWSEGKPLKDETLWRVALEADNDTEAVQVISDKAKNYQNVMNDPGWWPYWSERYGAKAPTILWCAPDKERALEITHHWERTWPNGTWCVSHDAYMWTPDRTRRNGWILRHGGKSKATAIGFQPDRPRVKPAAPPKPPKMSQTQEEWEDGWRRALEESNAKPPQTLKQILQWMDWTPDYSGACDEFGWPLFRDGTRDGQSGQLNTAEQAIWAAYVEDRYAAYLAEQAAAATPPRPFEELIALLPVHIGTGEFDGQHPICWDTHGTHTNTYITFRESEIAVWCEGTAEGRRRFLAERKMLEEEDRRYAAREQAREDRRLAEAASTPAPAPARPHWLKRLIFGEFPE